jgi:hypothetical protein
MTIDGWPGLLAPRHRRGDGTRSRYERSQESDFPMCVAIYNKASSELRRKFGFEDDVTDDDTWLLKPLRHFL